MTDTSDDRCFWCNTSASEAAARHEGPHATWCVHGRAPRMPIPVSVFDLPDDGRAIWSPGPVKP